MTGRAVGVWVRRSVANGAASAVWHAAGMTACGEGHRGVVVGDVAWVRVASPVVFLEKSTRPPLLNVLWGGLWKTCRLWF